MNCDEFQSVVGDLARDQMMEATARTRALAHGASCDDCALRLADERNLTSNLRALAYEMQSLEAGPQVEARIFAAFRNRVEPAPVVVHSRRWYWVGAAAAAVLLVFGMVAIRGRVAPAAPEKTQAQRVDAPKAPTPSEERFAPVTVPPNQEAVYGPRPRRDVGRLRPPSDRSGRPIVPAAVASFANEIATDFFPVGDESASNLQDGAQLMRVELPRSTMTRFGLPVNTARANERVKADVLVSSDGLARAIRFVQ